MTARELTGQLQPYADEEIEQVVTESGENITGIYPDGTYIVLTTSDTDDSLSVDGLIAGLERLDPADQEREVVTDSMADICSAAYECVCAPTVYLKHTI